MNIPVLSGRQYAMLRMFFDQGRDSMRISDAQQWNQTTFRSMLIRNYISYTGHGFRITKEGDEAMRLFEQAEIARSASMTSQPLTRYFDPAAYGVSPKKRAVVHVMRRNKRAA